MRWHLTIDVPAETSVETIAETYATVLYPNEIARGSRRFISAARLTTKATGDTREMISFGVMQGRLLPRYNNRYQAFPRDYWQAEFDIARDLGFQHIEFILDEEGLEDNPLMKSSGLREIQRAIARTGVVVRSVCADFLMCSTFTPLNQERNEKILKCLLLESSMIGVRDVIIPCVDSSSLKDSRDHTLFIESMRRLGPHAGRQGVTLSLETDLCPREFFELLNKIDSPSVKVNYDIGNSASLGYDAREEFAAYGHLISDLHVKDRIRGGTSVKLGTGAADFDLVFSLLADLGFNGCITLQGSRLPAYLGELEYVNEQRQYTENLIRKYLGLLWAK